MVWLVWQISGLSTCAGAYESWHSDTDSSAGSRGQWLYHTQGRRSLQWQTPQQWKQHGSPIPQNSFINVSSGSWKLFKRRPLTRKKNFPPITRDRRAVSTFVTLMSRMMKGTAFHFVFQSKIALCRLSRRALTEISLLSFFWWIVLTNVLSTAAFSAKANQRRHRSLQQLLISWSGRKKKIDFTIC